MRREEFIRQLETLLQDVPEEEKQEALSYYRSYFEDAGEENEERILKELESPEKVAATIKADLGMDLRTAGEYTEHGFEDSRFEKKQEVDLRKRDSREEQTQRSAEGNDSSNRSEGVYKDSAQGDGASVYTGRTASEIALIVFLIILTSPFWIGAVGGIAGSVLGLVISVVCIAGAFYITGGVLVGIGISQIVTGSLAVGLSLMGGGLLFLALAVLATILSVWVFGKLLPWLCSLAKKLWRSLFSRKEERA